MDAQVLTFFALELLEKTAAGPLIIDVDDPRLLSTNAVNLDPKSFLSTADSPAKTLIKQQYPEAVEALKAGRGVIMLPSKANLAQNPFLDAETADATYKQLRRHEMTHWMRGRKGKDLSTSPGIRGVLRNAREELAATASQTKIKGVSPAITRTLQANMVPAALASVKSNYAHQGGPLKAMAQGSLKKVFGALKR